MLFRTREARRWRWCLVNFAFSFKLILGQIRLKCDAYLALAMYLIGQSSLPAVWYSIVPTLGLDDYSSLHGSEKCHGETLGFWRPNHQISCTYDHNDWLLKQKSEMKQ